MKKKLKKVYLYTNGRGVLVYYLKLSYYNIKITLIFKRDKYVSWKAELGVVRNPSLIKRKSPKTTFQTSPTNYLGTLLATGCILVYNTFLKRVRATRI